MAPTTMVGQKTTTTLAGRNLAGDGPPMKMCEFLSTLEGTAFLARSSVHSAKHIQRTKKYIREAFQTQLDDEGFSMVEILSPCPSNWKLSAVESCRWIEQKMIQQFPLGVVKERQAEPS